MYFIKLLKGLGLFSDNKILAGQDILKIPLETCIYIGILQDYDIFWEMVYSKIKDQVNNYI